MLKTISILIISLSFYSCNETESKTETVEANNPNVDTIKDDKLFISELWSEYVEDDSVEIKLLLDLEKTSIVTEVELLGGAWIVSPLAEQYPYGKMELSLEENDFVSLDTKITQHPEATVVSDHNTDEPYGIIQNSAVIQQKIKLTSTNDFEVKGELFYLLEPICLPFRIDFILSSKNNELSIQTQEVFAMPTN